MWNIHLKSAQEPSIIAHIGHPKLFVERMMNKSVRFDNNALKIPK